MGQTLTLGLISRLALHWEHLTLWNFAFLKLSTMDELLGSFLSFANTDGFERVILIIFPSQRERLACRVSSRINVENRADDS